MKTQKKYKGTLKKYLVKTEEFWNNFGNILEDTRKTKKKLLVIFQQILGVLQKTSQKS